MKYVKQFLIIIGISLAGEILKYILPLPIPASIYGMAILFIALLIISRIPYRYYDSGVHYNSRISYLLPQYEYTVSAYNCFGETIYKLKSGAYDESNATLGEMKDASEMLSTHIYGFELLYNNDITIAIICVLILSVVWNVGLFVVLNKIKHNKLFSKEEEIYCRFGTFSKKDCFLSFDKIQSLSVHSNLKDGLIGGKTVVVYGTSISIKVPCVQNADEFVNATLAEIKKWKDAKEVTLDETKNSDTFDDIQKLKNLLEQGLISQEEYDAKRQELIHRI